VNAAVRALGRLGAPQAAPHVLAVIERMVDRVAVLEALAALGDRSVAPALVRYLADESDEVARAAARAIATLAEESTVAALRHPPFRDTPFAYAADLVLSLRDDEDARARLEAGVRHPDARIRRRALAFVMGDAARAMRLLLSKDLDAQLPFVDPMLAIGDDRLARAAALAGVEVGALLGELDALRGRLGPDILPLDD
jgi:HEAT repeat protein